MTRARFPAHLHFPTKLRVPSLLHTKQQKIKGVFPRYKHRSNMGQYSELATTQQIPSTTLLRENYGELIQIDGNENRCFEERGEPCTLLVFIDAATSKLMHRKRPSRVYVYLKRSQATRRMPAAPQWKCRSDGKRGKRDDEAVLFPPLPTDLGNRQRATISHIPTARRLRSYTDISKERMTLSFLSSSNIRCRRSSEADSGYWDTLPCNGLRTPSERVARSIWSRH